MWSSTHHPFAAPMYEDLPAFYAGDYGRVRGQHYDLVLNGVEIGGGSVRIHDPAMQEYVFRNVLQVSTYSGGVLFFISSSLHTLVLDLPTPLADPFLGIACAGKVSTPGHRTNVPGQILWPAQ